MLIISSATPGVHTISCHFQLFINVTPSHPAHTHDRGVLPHKEGVYSFHPTQKYELYINFELLGILLCISSLLSTIMMETEHGCAIMNVRNSKIIHSKIISIVCNYFYVPRTFLSICLSSSTEEIRRELK